MASRVPHVQGVHYGADGKDSAARVHLQPVE